MLFKFYIFVNPPSLFMLLISSLFNFWGVGEHTLYSIDSFKFIEAYFWAWCWEGHSHVHSRSTLTQPHKNWCWAWNPYKEIKSPHSLCWSYHLEWEYLSCFNLNEYSFVSVWSTCIMGAWPISLFSLLPFSPLMIQTTYHSSYWISSQHAKTELITYPQ